MEKVKDKKLYNKVKEEAKSKFVWPSVYGSSWLVREYKKRGGKYKGKKDNNSGLSIWYKEEWINICKLPKEVKCGRKKINMDKWKSTYPYCRPKNKVTSKTPKTVSELTKKEIKIRFNKKKTSPSKKVKG